MKKWLGFFALLFAVSMAMGQPCVPSYPEVISVGTSHCIQVCPNSLIVIEFDGSLIGPGAVPVIIMEAGCQTNYCNTDCTPIVPPAELILGGDPFYPEDYYGQSDCLEIYLRWVHTDVWAYEVFSLCEGCFCVTFDHQLSVDLVAFTATTGSESVELNWTTASEANNDRFEIFRDGQQLAELSAVSSPSGATYQWQDGGLANGMTYHYVLWSVSTNGTREELGSLDATPSTMAAQVTEYALQQNYPNPFNASTNIMFDLVEPGMATITIYDMTGREAATLLHEQMNAGRHVVNFDAGKLPSGMYLYRLEVNGFAVQKKMLLLK